MKSIRKTAIIVGVLFIIASAAPLLSAPFTETSRAPDYLLTMSGDQGNVIVGALLEFIMALAIAGVAVFAYPVLRKQNEGLALGYVGLRVFEGVFLLAATVPMLSLLTVSQEFVAAGAPLGSHFQTTGELLLSLRDWASHGFATIAFCLSGLVLYSLLFKSRLVPRWLSGWGFQGAVLSLGLNRVLFVKPRLWEVFQNGKNCSDVIKYGGSVTLNLVPES